MKVILIFFAVVAVFGARDPQVKTCHEKADPGLCEAYMPMYYYDIETRTCKGFIYGGCQGNGNRYRTEEECLAHCAEKRGILDSQSHTEVCNLPKEIGPCYARFLRYYFDKSSGECKQFTYGGCKGNRNNFKTLGGCQSYCPDKSRDTQAAPDRSGCEEAPEPGLCDAYFPRFYYDRETGTCKEFIYGGCGGNRNNFRTKEECYNRCGETRK